MSGSPELDAFLAVSAQLTGYPRAALLATGCAESHLAFLRGNLAPRVLARLLAGGEEESGDLGQLGAAVVELWYLGAWRGVDGGEPLQVVSPRAYREGLVWDAIGAHPMGAKQQGFGSWALPPAPEDP